MDSVLRRILTLRDGRPFRVDSCNSSRYRLIAVNEDGTRTAYYFGVPIYNQETGQLVDLRFFKEKNNWKVRGSNGTVRLAEEILLENKQGSCRLCLPDGLSSGNEREGRYGPVKVKPTLNGICLRIPCKAGQPRSLILREDPPFRGVRDNDRCFSLLQTEVKPFITLSCMGAADAEGHLTAAGRLTYQRKREGEYVLTVSHTSPYGRSLWLEINLQEDKLFQDTTVESRHPEMNNAFGTTAFIGNTGAWGEQWLYMRPDFSKIPELYDKPIRKAVLHFPCHGGNEVPAAKKLEGRFCSFGSNWNQKISPAGLGKGLDTAKEEGKLNITDWITDPVGFLKPSEGWVLKLKAKQGGFFATSTGDSFFEPLVLEVDFDGQFLF